MQGSQHPCPYAKSSQDRADHVGTTRGATPRPHADVSSLLFYVVPAHTSRTLKLSYVHRSFSQCIYMYEYPGNLEIKPGGIVQ